MSEKFYSKYTNQEIEKLLDNSSNSPFYLYYDKSGSKAMYRLFSIGPESNPSARQQAWVEARDNNEMTPEISAYLIGSFEAPAPYTVTLSFTSKEQAYIRNGETGQSIDFTFFTADSSGTSLSESIQVVYSFNNAGFTQSATKIYNSGESVKMNIDKYLSIGDNTITLSVTGRVTGATAIYIIHYNVIEMNLSTSFNVAVPQTGTELTIPYTLNCSASGVKYIQFYLDGVLSSTIAISDNSIDSSTVLNMPSTKGKHHLQIRAYVEAGEGSFYSQTLYREFVIVGNVGIYIMLSVDLASGTLVEADKTNLFLRAEQYVQSNVIWGYYSSSGASATVRWSLEGEAIRSTEAQVTDAESNAKPYTLSFVPTKSGTLTLRATINDAETDYSLLVEVNKSGVSEATVGLNLKLLSLGRDNNEPADERCVWEYETIKAQFPDGWAWSERQGWVTDEDNNTALAVSGGKQVTIPFAPLSYAPQTNGCTVEIDFETYDIDDENAVVLSIWGNNIDGNACGIKITAEGIIMQKADGKVMKTQFKQSERIKVAFVINRKDSSSFPHLAFMMVNGVYERALDYGENGTFTNSANIVIGDPTGKASIKLYGIRCYQSALDVKSEMYNYFIDSGLVASKLIENDIYTNGIVSVEKMQGVIPVMLIDPIETNPSYNNIETLEKVKDKNTKINVNVTFYNPDDPSKNFSIAGARMKLQGTSSLGYPRKNFKLYSKKDDAVMTDFEGKTIAKGLYAFQTGDVPVNTWTLKADFMDSSCTRNASVARIFGDIEPNLNIKNEKGEDALKTTPQLIAKKYKEETGVEFPYKLRTTPNGLAMVMFHRLPGATQYTFLGQYTLLNDKGNEYVYGFHSIYKPLPAGDGDETAQSILSDPMAMYMKDSVKDSLVNARKIGRIFDNKDVHCYEILDNVNEFSNFNTVTGWSNPISVDDSKFKHCGWEAGFESRYPEIDDDDYSTDQERLLAGEEAGAPLKAFIEWMLSCYDGDTFNLTRFESQMKNHLNLYFCAGYYVYFMRWGAVDQIKKNMMWTTYGDRSNISSGTSGFDNLIWFPIRYDNDSTIDTRNDGSFFYNYKFTRDDLDPSTQGAYYYSGHDSLLWNALEQSSEFMQLVISVDTEFYASGLTYDQVIYYYDTLARDKWCESIYNENQYYKYISTLLKPNVEDRADYLDFLHGNDKSHQHWWLRNRFDMIDAKWGTGEFSNKFIHILCPACPVTSKIWIKSCKNTSFGIVRNKVTVPQDNGEFTKQCNKDQENFYLTVNFSSDSPTAQLAIGDPIYINGGNNIEELDLHEFAPYFSRYLEFDKIYDSELGSNMKKLILGISDESMYNSGEIATITGIESMSRLEYLDMRGLAGVSSFPFLRSLPSLKTLLLKGTGMTSFSCADGAYFDTLQLPETLISMTLSRVNWDELDYTPTTTLRSINFNYMSDQSNFPNIKSFIFDWLDALENNYGMTSKWGSFTLTLTGVNWTGVEYHVIEQLMNLGACNLSGHSYIKCTEEFTSAQMTEMIRVFGDSIFTDGSDLVIDCNSSKIVLGVKSVNNTPIYEYNGKSAFYEGGSIQLIATGFPIRNTSGSSNTSNITFGFSGNTYNCDLNPVTGVVTEEEFGYITANDITFSAYNSTTHATGTITVTLLPLTYPETVTITKITDSQQNEIEQDATGVYNITANDVYTIYRTFEPTPTGTITSYTWNYSNSTSAGSVNTTSTNKEKLVLNIHTLTTTPKEETISYTATFKNQGTGNVGGYKTINSPTITLSMFVSGTILINVYTNDVKGNPELYSVIIGYLGDDFVPTTPNELDSLELRNVIGELRLNSTCGVKRFESTINNVLDYLTNISALNCKDCSTLVGNVDVKKLGKLISIDLTGTKSKHLTGVNNKTLLTKINYGSPWSISINNCPELLITNVTEEEESNGNV